MQYLDYVQRVCLTKHLGKCFGDSTFLWLRMIGLIREFLHASRLLNNLIGHGKKCQAWLMQLQRVVGSLLLIDIILEFCKKLGFLKYP